MGINIALGPSNASETRVFRDSVGSFQPDSQMTEGRSQSLVTNRARDRGDGFYCKHAAEM